MRIRALLAFALLAHAVPLLAAVRGWVLTPDGQPVPGAAVTLSRPESPLGQRERLAAGKPVPTLAAATTDARGGFSIDTEDPGIVDVTVSAPGFQPVFRRVTTDAELGAFLLEKTSLRSGMVRAAGKAVAGATVVLNYAGAEYLTKSDESGRYSAPDSDALSWRVVIQPGFAVEYTSRRGQRMSWDVALVTGTTVSGRTVGPDGKPVAGARIAVDGWPVATSADDGTFTVPHLPSSWRAMSATAPGLSGVRFSSANFTADLAMRRTGHVTGSAVDVRSGQPIPGAVVVLSSTWFRDSVVADARGRFAFRDFAPGTYGIAVSHPRYFGGREQFVLEAGQTRSRDLAAEPLAVVSGSVTDESRSGVAAAIIRSERVEGTADPMGASGVQGAFTTGPDGLFTVHIRASTVRLLAVRRGFPRGRSAELNVVAGARLRNVAIVIPRGFPVSGRVLDPDRKPLAGVSVFARPAPSGAIGSGVWSAGGVRSTRGEDVLTAVDGSFTLRLEEGTFELTFRRAGLSTTVARAVAVTAETKPVEVTMGPSIDISGRVVRKGAGVDGIMVSATQGVGSSSTMTEGDGSFVLTDLREGPVRVSLEKSDGFFSYGQNLEAPASDVVLELPDGGTIRGRVIDKSTRQPVRSFSAGLSLRHEQGTSTYGAQLTFSSETGTFTLEDIGSGLARVVIEAPGYARAESGALTIEPGKSVDDVVIEAEKGIRVTGQVTAPDGTPLFGAFVTEVRPRTQTAFPPPSPNSATTDAKGTYTFAGVTAGEKTFEFMHRDYVSVRKDVIAEGSEVRLDAQLDEGITVSGDVVTESGQPVGDALVVANGTGMRRETRTDGAGVFRLPRVAPGRQSFRATKDGFAEGELRDVEVTAGKPIRITMPAGCTIHGRVTGLDPSQLSLVTVTAFARGGSPVYSAVDPSGNYRLRGAAPGKVRLEAALRLGSTVRSAMPVHVDVAAGETKAVDLEFVAGSTITGKVSRSGKPLAGAMVRFEPRGAGARPSAAVVTSQDGTYAAHDLADGDYNVSVHVDGRAPVIAASYTVRGPASFDLDLKGVTIRGRVLDTATGEPLPEPRVQLRPEGTNLLITRTSHGDYTGSFGFDDVLPGRYTLIAEKEGYASGLQPLLLTDAASESVTLRLSPVEGVQVKLVDARTAAPADGHVGVRDGRGQPVWTGAKRGTTPGEIHLFLQPGTYTATAEARGYLTHDALLTAPGSQTIQMVRGGSLDIRSTSSEKRSIRIVDASGRAFGGPQAGNTRGVPTFVLPPAGVTLRNIPEGTYTIQLLGEKSVVLKTVIVTVVAGQTVLVEI